ncbi:MAG: hypothetical protein ACUVTP_05350 [Candidatus Fervidibacter sp.]|uniref:hypothetical protein n=1 Tax=Candidatus Fervidibacter sp. TaxID=3100871 RepID=UPI00404B4B6E
MVAVEGKVRAKRKVKLGECRAGHKTFVWVSVEKLPVSLAKLLAISIALFSASLAMAQAPQNQGVQIESELPIRYFPQEREWRTVDGTGLIKLNFRELTIFARRARYNERERIFEAQEGLRAIWQDGVEFEGGKARYFVNERRWVIEGGKATFEPEYFGEGVAAPLYLTLQNISGTDERLTAEQGAFSSCDRPHPHYSLRAKSAEAIPGDRLILRKVGIYIGETKLLDIGRFTVSLKPRLRRNRLPVTPDVGNDRYSGFFIRTSLSLFDTRSQSADLVLDWSERRGIGYGIEHDYSTSRLRGGANFFIQRSPFAGTEQTFSWRHEQRLLPSLLLTAFWDERRNTPFGGRSYTNSSKQFSLRQVWKRGSTELALRILGYGGYGEDRTWTINHSTSTGRQFLSVFTTLREVSRPGQPTDKELNERLEFRRRLSNEWDMALRFEQRVDLDKDKYTGDNFYYALDRTPEVLFTFRPRSAGFFRPNLAIGLARWSEPQFAGVQQPVQRFTSERLHLRFDTPYKTVNLTGNLSYSHAAVFEQFLYGNDTAQYLYSYRGTLTFKFGGRSQMDLSYWLQKHRGYTPFRSDTLTSYENLDWRLQFSPSQKFFLSATTGLDLERDFFRDLLLNVRWQPLQGMALDLSTGYSLERGKWQDILGRILLSKPGGLGLPAYGTFVSYYGLQPTPFVEERPAPPPRGFRSELTFRYSPAQGQWTRVRLFLDWSITRTLRLESLVGYSGVLKKMDIAQFRLMKDFHCYQIWAIYNRERREFRVFFVIKAFPLLQQFFGTSDQGAFLDTSLGQVY